MVLLFFLCFGLSSAFSRTIKIGYVEFFPMTYTNDSGHPDGIIINIAAQTLEKAGYEWTATSLPAKRLAKMLTQGDVQLWIGLSTLPQFKDKVYISDTVVEKLTFRAYTIGKRNPIVKKQDLLGQTLLILRGYSYGGWINFIKDPLNQIQYIEFDSHETAFKRLEIFAENNRECYLLDYQHPSEAVLKTHDISNIHFNDISSLNIHFVVTQNMDGAKTVLDQIEKAFHQLVREGIIKNFERKNKGKSELL